MPSFMLMLWIWFMMIMTFISHGPTPNGPRIWYVTWRMLPYLKVVRQRWIWPWEGMSSSISTKKTIKEERRIRGKWWWPLLGTWGSKIPWVWARKREEVREKRKQLKQEKERRETWLGGPTHIYSFGFWQKDICVLLSDKLIRWNHWLPNLRSVLAKNKSIKIKLLFQRTERETIWDLGRKLSFYGNEDYVPSKSGLKKWGASACQMDTSWIWKLLDIWKTNDNFIKFPKYPGILSKSELYPSWYQTWSGSTWNFPKLSKHYSNP